MITKFVLALVLTFIKSICTIFSTTTQRIYELKVCCFCIFCEPQYSQSLPMEFSPLTVFIYIGVKDSREAVLVVVVFVSENLTVGCINQN